MRFAKRTVLLAFLCGTASLLGGCKSYSVTVQTEGQGVVTLDPDAASYAAGTPVTVNASSATGWHLDHWAGDLNGNTNPAVLIVDADKTVTAAFAVNTYMLTYAAGTGGTITGDATQTVNHGDSGTAVTAARDWGYHFVQWSDGYTNSSRTDTNVIGNVSVAAEFAPNIYRVDVNNTGAEDGLSWGSAFHGVQQASFAASLAGGGEVWVAGGVYTNQSGGNVVLQITQELHLYGGFAGNENERSQRNVAAHDTVIDGEDQYRCVEGSDEFTLDGFIIAHGHAEQGAGMYNVSCHAGVINNCIFEQNGAYNSLGAGQGGAMYNYYCDSTNEITNCEFRDNTTNGVGGGGGGAIFNLQSSPAVSNCVFLRNSAKGGSMAAGCGGAIHNYDDSDPLVRNCSFTGNQAPDQNGYGGAMYNNNPAPTVLNCTIVNCVFWGDLSPNAGEICDTGTAATEVSYSCVQGGHSGLGNINANPLFVDALHGYVQLKNGSPCIDKGNLNDAPAADIEGTPRPQGAGVDMGAYER